MQNQEQTFSIKAIHARDDVTQYWQLHLITEPSGKRQLRVLDTPDLSFPTTYFAPMNNYHTRVARGILESRFLNNKTFAYLDYQAGFLHSLVQQLSIMCHSYGRTTETMTNLRADLLPHHSCSFLPNPLLLCILILMRGRWENERRDRKCIVRGQRICTQFTYV